MVIEVTPLDTLINRFVDIIRQVMLRSKFGPNTSTAVISSGQHRQCVGCHRILRSGHLDSRPCPGSRMSITQLTDF
ncbi:uncharacterized protein METZ01_LOCUS45976 [marine metagenome]|uniref:Uncharacterized protein n=1 Tax=marine metagenome TaxID=408172 RepID=A0A381RMP6_9ZZZZ